MWRIMLVMGLVMAVMGIGGGFYFKWSQDKFADMNVAMGQMEADIAGKQAQIDLMAGRMDTIDSLNANYIMQMNIVRTETERLKNEISRSERHTQIATDPRAAEATLNARINARFDDLEAISRGENNAQ
jgi:type IV secretory pathway TrbF-like protein